MTKMDDYEILKPLGQGSFGKVFLVKHRATGEKLVMKQVPMPRAKAEQEECLREESRYHYLNCLLSVANAQLEKVKQEQELVDGINTYKQALADTETSIEEAHENLASTERDHAAIVAYLAAIEPDCTFYITNYETRKQARESEKAALQVGIEKLEASPVFKNAVAAQEREAYDIHKIGRAHV